MRTRFLRQLFWGLPLLFAGLLVFFCPPASAQNKRLVEVPISDAPSYAKRALVIGVDDYQIVHPLTDCGNDARAFADLLKAKFGFEHVTLMTDDPNTPKSLLPNGTNIRHQLRLLLDGVLPDKTELVLFYSGHGTRTHDAASGDADWLVPEDGDPGDIAHSCVNYSEFKSQLDTARPARALLVMDACRDLYAGKGVAGSGFGSKALTPLGPQVAELLSCQPTQVSQEGLEADFHQSVFTHFLLKGLSGDPDAIADGTSNVTFDSLKVYVQGQVSQYVTDKFNALQVPDGRATLGSMVLARVAILPPTVTPPLVVPPIIAPPLVVVPPVVTPPAPITPAPVIPAPVTPTGAKINPKDGAEMVYVASGPFLMGDDDESDNPRHTVTLSGYYIYKNDVTVAMYRKFCHATGRQMPDAPSWGWKDARPIVNVAWDDAKAYCDWAGVYLPTEAQWEKAARGPAGRKYPWGNDWDSSRLKCSKSQVGDAGSTAAVGSFPSGASPYGCLDMTGNAWQWCADWYEEGYWKSDHGKDPPGPNSGDFRVLRGGSWFSLNNGYFRAANRYYDTPADHGSVNGFRGAFGP